ncbi:putative acetyltransferase [Mycobacterium kansasii]|uniref:Putative acetyltransferase n=1 Tax=Mycobacterium kansasii TaxID=1768 RepID=A0A1V3W8W3_MYCKA|nr:putative acetyltransferase [Mycobacterium kansasii]
MDSPRPTAAAALVLIGATVTAAREFLPYQALTGFAATHRRFPVDGQLRSWRRNRHFTQGAPPSPLQHTWSLGVEEQYYIACRCY